MIIPLFTRAILAEQFILLGVIGLAMGLIYTVLRLRDQLDMLRHVWLPALLWTIFGSLDALVTSVGAWGDPWREANPLLRAWLLRDGWVGQVIYTFFYILIWAAVVIALEELRRRLSGIWAYLIGAAQLLILYRLSLEHFYGFLSWTPYNQPVSLFIAFFEVRTPWLFADSFAGYVLDFATALAAICAALHLTIAALLRGMRRLPPAARQARELAAQPGQVAKS